MIGDRRPISDVYISTDGYGNLKDDLTGSVPQKVRRCPEQDDQMVKKIRRVVSDWNFSDRARPYLFHVSVGYNWTYWSMELVLGSVWRLSIAKNSDEPDGGNNCSFYCDGAGCWVAQDLQLDNVW